MQRIRELDGLRALAIFAVFCVHFRPEPKYSFDIMQLGWAGVDLFFAISGFLITGILLKLRDEEHPFRTFYWRRVLRIFPPYYVSFALILVLIVASGWALPPSGEIASAATFLASLVDHPPSWHLVAARLFGHQGFWVKPVGITTPHFHSFAGGIGVFWSLSVEELFYLLWAPVILRGSRRTILTASLAPLLLCPVARAFVHTAAYPEVFMFFCRFDSLAAGGCVALLFAAKDRLPNRALERGLVLAMTFSGLFFLLLVWKCGLLAGTELRSTTAFAAFGYSLLAIFFAVITGACSHWSGKTCLIGLRWKPVAYVGKISYAMYLVHIPAYVAVGLLLTGHPSSYGLQVFHGLLAVMVTITLAAISWRYLESPILRLRNQPFSLRALRSMPVEASTGD